MIFYYFSTPYKILRFNFPVLKRCFAPSGVFLFKGFPDGLQIGGRRR